MMDEAVLARRYAEASDAELREAVAIAPAGFRPEAWRVIHAEAVRRHVGRQVEPHRPMPAAPLGRTHGPNRDEWTPGLLTGIVPAGAAAMAAFRAMVDAGMGNGQGARGVVMGVGVIFFVVWFGVALLVDWRRWWPGRR
jgi:hypothetical protein